MGRQEIEAFEDRAKEILAHYGDNEISFESALTDLKDAHRKHQMQKWVEIPLRYRESHNGGVDRNQLIDDLSLYLNDYHEDQLTDWEFLEAVANESLKRVQLKHQYQTYYAVVNDNPPNWFHDPIVLCGEHADRNGVYRNKEKAVQARDTVREQSGNSDINAYKIHLEPVEKGETS
ncbi:hypothetical protein OB919_16090 [Halobacteria archaeon AArc-curdl1]|uniref:Uncharacterized protein n=1 Tax=Natronosalvus hydrolyticus TaxID=2979988 RepID=A0AAP2ZAC7_9EURY|nr:hypothetical protein [Halobacteria archaeon AArc-curdl1]